MRLYKICAFVLSLLLLLTGCKLVHVEEAETQEHVHTEDCEHEYTEEDYETVPLDEVEGGYALNDDQFVAQLNHLAFNADQYMGETIILEGYVQRFEEDEDYHVQFSVLRDYDYGAEETDIVGLDCYYEGELPAEGAWVRVSGTLASYEDEEGYGWLMLMAQSIETLPQEGQRVVR